MTTTGTAAFRNFASTLLRVRKIEAQIAQERVFDRESFRASLTEQRGVVQANLANVYELHRMGSVTRG